MDVSPEVQQLALSLATATAKNSAQIVADQIRSLRASKRSEETISGLEQIINELINDKAEITRIAQAYQSELVAQRLSPGDVKYVADQVVPILEQISAAQGGQQAADFTKALETFKPLLSAETALVLQTLGFSFRRGIGEPLTQLLENAILSRVSRSDDLRLAEIERENLYARVALDSEAHARLMQIYGRA